MGTRLGMWKSRSVRAPDFVPRFVASRPRRSVRSAQPKETRHDRTHPFQGPCPRGGDARPPNDIDDAIKRRDLVMLADFAREAELTAGMD